MIAEKSVAGGGVHISSRISWASLLGGAVIAFSLFILFGMLNLAMGMSEDPGDEKLANRREALLLVGLVLPLFVGGWLTGQCTIGMTRRESVVHGVILWGLVVIVVAYLVIQGVTFGFSTLLEMAGMAKVNVQVKLTELKNISSEVGIAAQQVREAGDKLKAKAAGEQGQRTVWWTYAGLLGSLATAVAGTFLGACMPPMLRRRSAD